MTHEKLNMETPGIARENSKVREEGRSLIREFDGVVSTFDRVLQFKEGNRFSLLTKIDELKKFERFSKFFNFSIRALNECSKNVENRKSIIFLKFPELLSTWRSKKY